jgi:drug/metabolite transporter (DMT)-like permease
MRERALSESSAAPRRDKPVDAAISMVLAALSFALLSLTVKLAARSLNEQMVVFFRCAMSLLFIVPWLFAMRAGVRSLRTRNLKEHLVRAAAGMAAMYCFFFAIIRLGLAEALVLNYALPLFIPMVERIWLGQRVPKGIWWPVSLGLLGLILIVKPGTAIFQPAAAVGALAAVLAAIAQVGVRGLTQKESVSNIVFYFALFSTLISALPAVSSWVAPPIELWPTLLAMGLCATVAQLLMTRAYRGAPAAKVGPFIYTSVAFGAGIDWFVFEKVPDVPAAIGTLLIAVAATVALRLEA